MLVSVHRFFPVQYAGLHLIAMGAFSGGPIVLCWYIMNLHGHTERSIGTAWIISFGNTGGIVATFSFLATDAPRYTRGYIICLAVTGVGLLAAILYGLLVLRANRKLKSSSRQEDITLSSL